MMRLMAGLLAFAITGCRAPAPQGEARVLGGFDDQSLWQAEASDGVVAATESIVRDGGKALRLAFDFRGHGGHAGIKRMLPLSLPQNYEITLDVRGDAPANDLQFKLVDASGDNVWWFRRKDFVFPKDWQRLTFKKRQLEFAWGPSKERELAHAASIELVLAAGKGGMGGVEFDGLSLRELPLPPSTPPAPLASASASLPDAGPELALDGDADTAWRSAAEVGKSQTFTLDVGYSREFGGLTLRWAPGAHAARYDVELSEDGQSWQVVRSVSDGNGGSDALALPEASARFVRLSLHAGPGPRYGLAEIRVEDLAFGATPNAFVMALAREAKRGLYPRGFLEQTYWTLVAVDGAADSGLMSEDGALEVGQGGFSLEPFVFLGSDVVSWADVPEIEHALRDGYLPMPSVRWRHAAFELEASAFARGSAARSELAARYRVRNPGEQPLELRFALALRPFQVNPATQTLNRPGGVSPIHELAWDGASLWVDGRRALTPLVLPSGVALGTFDGADFPARPPSSPSLAPARVTDPTGMASAVLIYELELGPGQSTELGAIAPLPAASAQVPELAPLRNGSDLERAQAETAALWRERLNRVELQVPPDGQALVDTLRSSLAHILMSRDGPMLRPGTRSYARSWIRDGAMMSESLLRLGHEASVAEYLDWYAPHQFDNGKVPCCVDARGADPVPENDSAGELVFLTAELYRFTRDRPRLERLWPLVDKASVYLDSLRQSERTPKNEAPERRAFYGLLPPSISHEGYSDKPAYSYWDDFWGLIGYQDAAWLAEVLGERAVAERLARERDEFARELHASILASSAAHKVPFIPGAADRGDFDATSTTIALAPGREGARLPAELLRATFERYWQEFETRRSGERAWEAYTPYELRVVGTFIRLGWRERAQQLFDYFLASRRPAEWNQWAEVVGREPRQPRFIGDMPHAWIASDYIRSVLDAFAYMRDADQALVLAAGVPPAWFDGPGFSVRGLRTHYGQLGYSVRKSGRRVLIEVQGQLPPGGFVVAWPWLDQPASSATTVNGKRAAWSAGELRVREQPARITIERR